MLRPLSLAAALAACLGTTAASAAPLTSAFTYQGRLSASGQPANGAFDLRFSVFDGGRTTTPLAPAVALEDVVVTNGVFSVPLDFGFAVADGQRLFLALEVREGASTGAYTALNPRHELTPGVYALHAVEAQQALVAGPGSVDSASVVDGALTAADLGAGSVGAAEIASQAVDSDRIADNSVDSTDIENSTITYFDIAGNTITSGNILDDTLSAQDIGAGAVGTSELGLGAVTSAKIAPNAVGAGQIDSATVQRRVSLECATGSSIRGITAEGSVYCEPDDQGVPGWQMFGNTGTSGAAHYLGTADNQPFSLRVANKRVARYEPNAVSPNVLLGSEHNVLIGGVRGAAIGGGGSSASFADPDFDSEGPNQVGDAYGTIGGGLSNLAGTLDGGVLDAPFATVGGGQDNYAAAPFATVAGGGRNTVTGEAGFAAGRDNSVAGDGSVALGTFANAIHDGSFVFADRHIGGLFSTVTHNQFLVRAQNGVGINTNSNLAALNVAKAPGAAATATLAQFDGGSNVARILFRGTEGVELGFNSLGGGAFFRAEGGTLKLEPAQPGTRNPYFSVSATSSFDGVGVMRFNDSIVIMSAPGFSGNALQLLNGDASKPGGGSWAMASDARLKRDVQPLEGALDRLLALRGVTFEYKDGSMPGLLPGRQTGFIAQEVQRVFPDWVGTQENGYLSVSVRGFEALTVEALREIDAAHAVTTAALEARIDQLESENARLTAGQRAIETRLARLEREARP
jgi:hypothetical protein